MKKFYNISKDCTNKKYFEIVDTDNNGNSIIEETTYTLDKAYPFEIDELKEDNGKLVYNQSTKDVYNNYNQYCIANGLMQMSNIEVSRRICKEFGVTTVTRRVDGKRTRLFARNGIKESD